jgi:hypothetical protein
MVFAATSDDEKSDDDTWIRDSGASTVFQIEACLMLEI